MNAHAFNGPPDAEHDERLRPMRDAPIKARTVHCAVCGAGVRVLTAEPAYARARVVCGDCVREGNE